MATTAGGSGYDIGRAQGCCAVTGRRFEPGEVYVAALAEAESDETHFERFEYDPDAWSAGARPARLFAFWRAHVREPGASQPRLDPTSLAELFDTLADETDPRQLALRYVVALWLLRKRHLLPAGSSRATDRLLVRARGMDEEDAPIEVVVPALDDEALRSVVEELGQMLELSA